MTDLGNLSMSWEDLLSEECLFYTVLLGAMELFYRTSIESHTNSVERLFYTVLPGAVELYYRTSIDSHTNSVMKDLKVNAFNKLRNQSNLGRNMKCAK
ncbi:hypothetical protein QJS10_CPA01g02780 [Acorus calamus]|uniref:Uncharacterized protein n=1 Tax=Acorus calamus TaxID=4465 RepID=A0AAV9FJW5_ACOCL|nr:hypothetical protein QJS10_CPA01g02780 [Acorus calamus]